MNNLPIRPALISLFLLCAMISLGLLACGSNDAGDAPGALRQGAAATPTDAATMTAALQAAPPAR
jgi:hypothetical protein